MFDWREYFTLAERLWLEPGEASKRTAVSRAYYAIFCLTHDRLLSEGVTFRRENIHAEVWNHLEASRDRDRLQLVKMAKRLRDWRNQADYDGTISNINRFAETAVKYTASYLKLYDRVWGPPGAP